MQKRQMHFNVGEMNRCKIAEQMRAAGNLYDSNRESVSSFLTAHQVYSNRSEQNYYKLLHNNSRV